MYNKYFWILLNLSVGCQSILKPFKNEFSEINLAECIINIWKNDLNKELPIFIQTPGNYQHPSHRFSKVGQKLIQILQSHINFPQITFDASEANTHKRYEQGLVKPGSYIVLLPRMQSKSDYEIVKDMLETMFWNVHSPKSKVVVAAVEKTIRRNREPNSNDFMYALLKIGFTQVVVLEPRSRSGRYIDVYTWLINEQNNICSDNIDNIKLIDTWKPQEKKFIHGKSLFETNPNINLRGCVLNILFSPAPPYIIPCKNGICGIINKIFKILKTLLNFNVAVKVKDIYDYDIVFPYMYDPEDTRFECLLTYPLYYFDMRWLVPSSLEVPRWQVLFYTFNRSIWALVILTFTCGSFTMWLLQKSSIHSASNANEGVIISALLTHLEAGVGEKYKGSVAAVFFVLWLYYCMIINTAYQSQFFERLVHPKEMPEMKTIKEVEQSGLIMERVVSISSSSKYLSFVNNYKHCEQNGLCWDGLKHKRTHAILADTFCGRLMERRTKNNRQKSSITILPEGVGTLYLSLGIRKWSLSCALQEAVDRILHRLIDAGLVSWSLKTHFWDMEIINVGSNELPPFSFSLLDLQSAFYLLIFGILVSSLVFTTEKVVSYLHSYVFLQTIIIVLENLGLY
ncbi:Ionotropic receptor 349 [Blattella germanica]|nr:Ionotropic receptor 349 [Blattella germanica]